MHLHDPKSECLLKFCTLGLPHPGPGCLTQQKIFIISHSFTGSNSAGWFSLRVSHEVVVKMSTGIAVIWRLDWGWKSSSKVAPSHGWQVSGSRWQEASVLSLGTLHNLLGVLVICQLSEPRRKVEATRSFIIYAHKLHTIISTIFFWPQRPTLMQCRRGLRKGVNNGSLAAILKAAYFIKEEEEERKGKKNA